MRSIETCGAPLVFRVADPDAVFPWPVGEGRIRTLASTLTGMQKEALVGGGASGWRMVSDEGPYLAGTDLAPFPLAFFTAGLAVSWLDGLRRRLGGHGVDPPAIRMTVHSRYTMEGSALQGTMRGAALPVEVVLAPVPGLEPSAVAAPAHAAIEASAAGNLLARPLPSLFSITHAGRRIPTGRVQEFTGEVPPDPGEEAFARAQPADAAGSVADAIARIAPAPVVEGEGEVGSSLRPEQRRTLHVEGRARLRPDGLAEVEVLLHRPIGSRWRFLGEGEVPSPEGRVPSGLHYLCAGIAFCWLTQVGRYAHITKRRIDACRIVQDASLQPATEGAPASVEPLACHVFVDSPEDPDVVLQVVDMGEQTCFLHAACRSPVPVEVRVAA